MKVQVLSDLHLEFSYYGIEIVEDADVLVIAGDYTIARKIRQLKSFAQSITKPVLFVAGNHDYYGGNISTVNEYLAKLDSEWENFYFLNNRSILLDSMTFIGCTLWSNFDLAPNQDDYAQNVGPFISDFSVINKDVVRKFTPSDCRQLNEQSREYLKSKMRGDAKRRKVLVTHFLPSSKSIHQKFKDDDLNPYFCCNCEDLMGPEVPLWIRGHTHESMDYFHKGTHIIANPRGYFGENKRFNGKLALDL